MFTSGCHVTPSVEYTIEITASPVLEGTAMFWNMDVFTLIGVVVVSGTLEVPTCT
jgi:hypothetical protein